MAVELMIPRCPISGVDDVGKDSMDNPDGTEVEIVRPGGTHAYHIASRGHRSISARKANDLCRLVQIAAQQGLHLIGIFFETNFLAVTQQTFSR